MKSVVLNVAGFLAISCVSSQAAILWKGGNGTNAFDDANWDFSGSSVSTVASNTSINDDVSAEEGVNIQIDPFNGADGSQVTVLAVPEPGSSILIALGGVILLARRRK